MSNSPDIRKRVGQNIVRLRGLHEPPLTQGELARRTGIRRERLSDYERGVHEPSHRALVKIARELGVDFGEFYSNGD